MESPSSGDLDAGKVVTFTVGLSEAVTVASGGTPTLSLNDGGTATYVRGSRATGLVFGYTVAAVRPSRELAVTSVNPNGAIITDGAGNAASLSLAGLTQSGPQIDTTTPSVTAATASPSIGDEGVGKAIPITLTMSEAVTVSGGTPTLNLNDGGTASYDAAHSTATSLVFDYTVASGQTNVASLAVTSVSLNGATITDGAGNVANLSGADVTFSGLQIDTTTPSVTAATASPSTGDEGVGKAIPITLTLSEAVTVSGGTPTLTLNDGGTASYDAAHSTATSLVFDYTVASGQTNVASLAVTSVSLNGATITDGAGNVAILSGADVTFSGLQIDTTTPSATAATASPSTGDEGVGKAIPITLTLSEAVMVSGGTPTLTLNDGGTASYDAAHSTATSLVFDYTVASGRELMSPAWP